MLTPQQIKKRRKIIQDRIKLKEEEEANEIVRRLAHGKPKYIELAHKPFTVEFWITWPPKNEKQKISQTEEISSGSRGDHESSSCPLCEANIKKIC